MQGFLRSRRISPCGKPLQLSSATGRHLLAETIGSGERSEVAWDPKWSAMTKQERDELMHHMWKVERKSFPQIARKLGIGRNNVVVVWVMRHLKASSEPLPKTD